MISVTNNETQQTASIFRRGETGTVYSYSMRRLLVPFLVLAASPLFALGIPRVEIFPPAPDSATHIHVRFGAVNCFPVTHVAVVGSTIKLTSTQLTGGCLPEQAPVPAIADVGVLAPGVYSIETESGDHASLIVRDADSGVVVSPVGESTTGGRTIQIFTDSTFGLPASVSFDGLPAKIEAHADKSFGVYVVVTPPPHAAGTVNVTLFNGAETRTSVAAFTYFDPAAPPDPAVFEPVLFPVAYDGPGVFGSQWRTENLIGTGKTVVRFREPQGVSNCDDSCGVLDWSGLLQAQSRSGLLVWTVRRRTPVGVGVDDEFRVSSRVFESSRDDGGIPLPVVREGDFRNNFVIDNVPVGNGARVTMRVYSLEEAFNGVITVTSGGRVIHSDTHPLAPVNGVAFVSFDIPANGLSRTQPAKVTAQYAAKVWGLITVTDNVTQQVTAYWPQ